MKSRTADFAFLAIYEFFDMSEESERLRDRLSRPEGEYPEADETSPKSAALLERLLIGRVSLSEEEINTLETEVGFAGSIAAAFSYELESSPKQAEISGRIREEARPYLIRVAAGSLIFVSLMAAGFVLLPIFVVLEQRQNSWRDFLSTSAIASPTLGQICFESFTLYLFVTVLLGQAFSRLDFGIGFGSARLVIVQGLSLCVALYPLLQSVSRSDLRDTLGANPGAGRLREIAFGPLAYSAALPLLLAATLLTTYLAKVLDWDLTESIHPLVREVADSSGVTPNLAGLFFAAVVMAPLVEEVMFRGFLYRALRCRLSVAPAICISAAVFAGIHPQGLPGFPALFTIGCVLAFLREWRGSLIAPMVTHACVNGVSFAMILVIY